MFFFMSSWQKFVDSTINMSSLICSNDQYVVTHVFLSIVTPFTNYSNEIYKYGIFQSIYIVLCVM